MKKFLSRVLVVARNPAFKPIEVWALRAAYAYVALKLGLDAKHLAQ